MKNAKINVEISSNLYDIDLERSILSSIFYNDDGFSEILDIINSQSKISPKAQNTKKI